MMSYHPHVTGVVLAGGRARRMRGVNKAMLPLGRDHSVTPLARILHTFRGRFAASLIVTAPPGEGAPGGGPALYAGLPASMAWDRQPGCGPLGGLHAALEAIRTPFAFVCGCDMPSLSGPLLDLMAQRAIEGRALVPVRQGRPEPLHAIYPASCLAEAERALGDGIRMMLDFLERVPADYLREEQYAGIEGASRSFTNINTPEDLEEATRGEGPGA